MLLSIPFIAFLVILICFFLLISDIEHLFMFINHSYIFVGKRPIQISCLCFELFLILLKHMILYILDTAAAAAKSLQLCPTLCDPVHGSPLGSPVPGILQARTLEWVAISFSNAWKWKVKVKLLSRVWLLATPWTAAHQAPPPMGFSRQEYWRGVPLPSPLPKCIPCSWPKGASVTKAASPAGLEGRERSQGVRGGILAQPEVACFLPEDSCFSASCFRHSLLSSAP